MGALVGREEEIIWEHERYKVLVDREELYTARKH